MDWCAISIEKIMAGNTIRICNIGVVAKMSSNNCGISSRQSLAMKQINEHLSKFSFF